MKINTDILISFIHRAYYDIVNLLPLSKNSMHMTDFSVFVLFNALFYFPSVLHKCIEFSILPEENFHSGLKFQYKMSAF